MAKGVPFAIVAFVSLGLMNAAIKLCFLLDDKMDSMQVLYWRGVPLAMIAFPVAKAIGFDLLDNLNGSIKNVLLRCILSQISATTFYQAIKFIPLSIAVLILKMQPIYLTILAMIFLKEKVTKVEVLGILLSLLGVIMISFSNITHSQSHYQVSTQIIGYFLVLLTGILFALSQLVMKMTGSKVFPMCWPFFTSAFSSIITPSHTIFLQQTLPISDVLTNTSLILCLLCVSLFLLIGHSCLVIALQNEKAVTVALFSNLETLTGIIVDVIWFRTSYTPWMIAGTIILVFVNTGLVAVKMKKEVNQ